MRRRHLIVDRTPFSLVADDRITIQHVSPMIYEASYPSWIFSERHFRERVEKHWSVQSVYDCAEGTFATDGGLAFAFKGMILTR
jgi:hypothetical protein